MNSTLLSFTHSPEPEVPANEGSYISLIRDFYTEDGTPKFKQYAEVTGDSRGAPAQAIDRNTVKNLARKMEACLEGKMPRESFRYQSNTKHRRRPVRTNLTHPREAEEILGGPSNASGFERPSELLSEKAQGKQKSVAIEDESMNIYASAEERPRQEIPLRAVEEASTSAVPNQGLISEFTAISDDVEMILPEAPLLPAMPFLPEAPVFPEASLCPEGQFNPAAPSFSEARPPDIPFIRDEDIEMADEDADMAEPHEYTPDLQHLATWETQANRVMEIPIPVYETIQPLYVFEELHGPEYFFNEAFFIHTMNATTFTPLEGTYFFDIWQGQFISLLSWIIMDSSILPCKFDGQLYRWVSLKEIPTPWPTRFVPPAPPPPSDVCQPHSEESEEADVCQPHSEESEEAENPCVEEEVSDIGNLSEPSSECTPLPAPLSPEWPRAKKRTRHEYEAERPVARKRRKLKHTSVRIDEYCLQVEVLMIEAREERITEAGEERVIEVGEETIIEAREENVIEAGGERRIDAREESVTEAPRPRKKRSKKSRSSRRRDSSATSTAAPRPPVPDIVPSTDVWPWTMIKPIAEFFGWV